MLFPITIQLLRCLPFERTLSYQLRSHLSRFLQTKRPMSFTSVHQTINHCIVSLMWMATQLSSICRVTKSFSFLLARGNYMQFLFPVKAHKAFQP